MEDTGELREGDLFAGHRIEGVAGRGGMGVVHRARALDLDRPVALKVIAAALASDPAFRERFIRETRVAASIDHPNVIPVFSAGEQDGRLFIAMRYVEGDDLRTLVRREVRLEPRRAAHLVAQVAAALDAVHARGIVHRDVKPANVLLAGDDHVYLTDFGLTKRTAATGASTQVTRPGGWVGTLGYVSPEQIRGERVDARTDVYALGCILFHALTGTTPFTRDSDEATLWAHLNAEPPPLLDAAPGVPPAFEAVVARALAKDPEDRFPSAGDLGRAALAAAGVAPVTQPERAVATGEAAPVDPAGETVVSPVPTTVADPPADRTWVKQALAILASLLVVVGAGAAAAFLVSRTDDEAEPTTPREAADARRARPATAGVAEDLIPAGLRPNALTFAAGKLWVVSAQESRLRLTDAAGVRVPGAPKTGTGVSAIDAGFGAVWIAKASTGTLLRYSNETARRVGAAIALPAGAAVAVATGEGAVWVGSRAGRGGGAQTVARVDPRTGTVVRAIPIGGGVQDLAVGLGAVWVVNRSRATLTRLDVVSGQRRRIPLGGDPQRIAIGQGGVWVSNDEGYVSQVDPGDFRVVRTIRVGAQPRGIAVGRGAVWVANLLDGTLSRIDPTTGRTVGEAVEVGSNPSAVLVRGRTVYATLLGDDAVARVGF